MEYLGVSKPINKIKPVVSVCITTYNHEQYIVECLDSILMQETDFPFEIILGEDESKIIHVRFVKNMLKSIQIKYVCF